jgi:hypothetical protein
MRNKNIFILLFLSFAISVNSIPHWVDAEEPVLDGMQKSSTPFTEEIKIDHKITKEDARGHQH